ncbi:MAG: hypothetical protein IPM98_12385 [Lewinellaceae bacterium]|nr:hypothetical protein [Lewinellaceae bacterium]
MRHIALLLSLFWLFNTPAFTQLSAEQWRADIALLQRELPKRHPNLYQYYPQPAFEADLAKLAENLEGKNDLQVALEIQAVVARFQDAHTRLELSSLIQQQGKVIPVGLGWYAEGLFVSGTVQRFAPALGKKVLEINGLETSVALERMAHLFARENEESVRRDAPTWLRFPEAMRLAGVAQNDTLALLVADEKGQRYFVKTYPIDFKTDKTGLQPAQFVPKNPDLRWNPVKQIYSLEWLEADRIVYLQYNACFSQEMALAAGDSTGAMQLPPFQIFVDSVLAILDRRPDSRFFLDLRFNNGGLPYDGIALADRLAAMPFVNLPNRIFVATNRYTSGAAVEIAAAFQARTNATLLGEAPAQRPNHIGDPTFLILPNSRIQVFYGTRQVQILPGNPDALRLSVPLELPFGVFRDGRDPLLDYVRRS